MRATRGLTHVRCDRIANNLLRTMMLIAFGLANLNNGLTSYVTKDSINEELHRNINQNLILSPLLDASGVPVAAALTAAAAAVAGDSGGGGSGGVDGGSVAPAVPYPPSSISASMTLYQQHGSGSSITSFDSTNVIDEKQKQQQHQQQQQQHHHHHRQPSSSNSRQITKVVGVGGGGGGGSEAGIENHLDPNTSGDSGDGDEIYAAPMYFGTENSTVVTTQIGATAHIPCTVHNIGDGVVSWIRKKDYHLLTVGLTTYSSDERFSATHLKHSEDWTLQIKFVQLRDAGVYECQVSTHPPTSIFLHLIVVEARAEISGPPIRYLTPGSTLRLQCRVVQNTEASEFIFWYHDNRMINYDIDRGINVSTDPDFQSSELTILRTRREHSGNFTCVASNTQPASVLVHIFKGDNPAAMYHGNMSSSTKPYHTHLQSIIAVAAVAYRILHTYVYIKIV